MEPSSNQTTIPDPSDMGAHDATVPSTPASESITQPESHFVIPPNGILNLAEPPHVPELPEHVLSTGTTPHPTPSSTPTLQTINRAGVFSLALIGIASFVITTSYLQAAPTTSAQSTVAAAQAAVTPPKPPTPPITLATTTLRARAVYVIDLTNNSVLYNLNADAQLPLASITKVPLALVVSQVMPLDTHITIPRDSEPSGVSDRLAQGDVWRIADVIDLTLTASSNGGAEILADVADEAIREQYPEAPADTAALWRMNQLTKELNLQHTYFLNVSGLDESTTQSGAYGSAREVAQLFAYAATSSPEVFAATTLPSFSLTSVNGARATAINTDKALDAIPGIIMGKTGYTDLAGGNLAVVFNASTNHPVVAVVLGSTEQGRFDDMRKIVAAVRTTIHANQSAVSDDF